MKERPILFTRPMVRALLDGSKTQTRRLVKPQPLDGVGFGGRNYVRRAFGEIGDRLWVKEAWYTAPFFNHLKPSLLRDDTPIHYAADDGADVLRAGPLRSPLFMQRRQSRITLEVTSVRVKRLQGVSEMDAEAEGVDFLRHHPDFDETLTAVHLYKVLWESINGEGSWALNPWVWVIEFRRVEA